jgi:ABC-type antimicrobial peptide transport system permease subunit
MEQASAEGGQVALFALLHEWQYYRRSVHTRFVPMLAGQEFSPTMPGLAEIEGFEEYFERLTRVPYSVTLLTTKDMTAMPRTQVGSIMQLYSGRWLDKNDYTHAHHVAVIDRQFAAIRGLELGDILTIDIPYTQYDLGQQVFGHGAFIFNAETGERTFTNPEFEMMMLEFAAAADAPMTQIELEIVGIQDFNLPHRGTAAVYTDLNIFIYVPASLDLPIAIGDDTVFDFAYSFVLHDARDEPAFMAEYGQLFSDMGFDVIFLGHGAMEFWAMADPINMSITINLVIFSTVIVLVSVLVVFVFLRGRMRDYAIARALGTPNKTLLGRMLATMSAITVPAIIALGTAAWFFGLSLAEEAVYELGGGLYHQPSIFMLVIMLAAIYAFIIFSLALGCLWLSRRSVLALLQGRA